MPEFNDRSTGQHFSALMCHSPSCGRHATHFASVYDPAIPNEVNKALPMCDDCGESLRKRILEKHGYAEDRSELPGEQAAAARANLSAHERRLTTTEEHVGRAPAQDSVSRSRSRRSETAQLMEHLGYENRSGNLRGMSTPVKMPHAIPDDMKGLMDHDKARHLAEVKARRSPQQRAIILRSAFNGIERQADGSYKETKRLTPPPGHKVGPLMSEVMAAREPHMEEAKEIYESMQTRFSPPIYSDVVDSDGNPVMDEKTGEPKQEKIGGGSDYKGVISTDKDVAWNFPGSQPGSRKTKEDKAIEAEHPAGEVTVTRSKKRAARRPARVNAIDAASDAQDQRYAAKKAQIQEEYRLKGETPPWPYNR